ncbi:hypothetical protein Cylst_2095 [Cylindrospermum stagnale PCC 7417]|uniref:Cytochrome c domain-containing protein n=1 Tax=Cylindrospermum stagnale PCC 7417 TaxID=56107 RepID=K9WWZ1_9NOST|nr:hypothetical protein [Cylindrospermum stagnale]AFZ24334.1 hypothetical protein Cylst_2095 [Cylindrospermum stagnale PCC 7417]
MRIQLFTRFVNVNLLLLSLLTVSIQQAFLFENSAFAYDPVEREAKAQERAQERANRDKNLVDHIVGRGLQTSVDAVKKSLREVGSPGGAIFDGGRSVVRECASCHFGGGGRNRNPN